MTAEELARRTGELITLPRAYHRINEMLDDPRYGAADIGKVVAHDPGLTARVLRLVNSAYYNFPSKIDTVPLAITVLGTRALRDLVLATAVASAFSRLNTRLVDVADFWHHSIYCGIMGRLLSKRLKIGESEQMFIAGLLHDLGKLVIYTELPERAAEALERFANTDEALYDVEQEVIGFTHSEVGAALLKDWELPELYQATTAWHHHPDRATAHQDAVALVHAANALSKKVEPGHKLRQDDREVPELHPEAAARVRLSPDLVEDLRLEADVQSIEVFSTLFAGTPIEH